MSFFFKSKNQASNQAAVSGLQIQSSALGKCIPIIYGTTRIAPNLIWYGDFVSVAHTSTPSSGGGKGGVGGGGGGKGGGGSVSYTYNVATALGLCEGPIQSVGVAYVDKNVSSLATLGMTSFLGGYSQSPWGYLTTNHSSQALNYHGLAYLAVASYQLGTSPQLPNHNFEVHGVYSNSISGKSDADASLVVSDLVSNSHYGAGFPSAYLGDFSVYQAYTIANGLWISPGYQEQAQCASLLNDIMLATNSEFVWSGGLLNIVPYGDQTITANGYTYTAPSSPQYSVGDDDYVGGGDSPVLLQRKRVADAYNSIKVECVDRSNSYNPAIIEAKDQAAIDQFGLRQDSKTLHLFADTTAAKLSAQLMLQRQSIKNIYTFTLDQRYIRLDPMDIIAITDSRLGLSAQWVRIIDITENDDYSLTMNAEEYLNGTGSAPAYSFQPPGGFTADYNQDPGNVNTPVIFEAPVQLATTGLEIWFALSGGSSWGGCDVYVSSDGNTYKLAGRITGPSRQGVLTATFPSGSDPDTTNNCSVNLSESYGALLSGTADDADLAHTLCYVDNELISYQTSTLTSAYNYTLGTYIRRGQFGTTISSHASGSAFARLDDGIFKYTYVKEQIGQTFYAKFISFNIYGGGSQSLVDVSPYTRTIVGPPIPGNVQNFSAQQNGGAVVFNWDEVTDFALKGYDILYGRQDDVFANATFLTESMRGTEMTNASVPPGTWRFYIRGVDIAGQYSATPTTFDLIVTDESPIISQAAQEPGWGGTLSNLVVHYTGVLIPTGIKTSDQYVTINPPSAPSLSYTSGGVISATTYYAKITYVTSGGETLASSESSLLVILNNLLVVTSPSTVSGATGWNIYVSNSSGTETLQNLSPQALGTDWTMPTSGLIAGAALPSANTTGWEVFNVFVPDPNTTASYTAPTIDTGYDDTLRAFSTTSSAMGYGQSGTASIQYAIDTWLTAGSDLNIFTNWVLGFILMRYIRSRITLTITAGSVPYITDFTPTLDKAPSIESSANVAVAPGGSIVAFPTQYHAPPFVQITVVSGSALIGTANNITATGFTAHVWNTSGSDVGGVINWSASGE